MQLCETQIVLSDLGDIGDHHVHVQDVHVRHVHEWEGLRGLGAGGRKKMAPKNWSGCVAYEGKEKM